MRPYNPMTVLRQGSRKLLKSFFEEHNCIINFNWECGKQYELINAFNCIPDRELIKIDRNLREIFFFASSDDILVKAIETAEALGYEFPEEFGNFKTRYDKALYIYLKYRNVWEATSLFAHSDQLSSQHWYRTQVGNNKIATSEQEALTLLGKDISAYFWQNQQRGKKHLVEYQKRHNGLEYYFVYLSDYSDVYEKWEDDSTENAKLIRREECRVFNIVFIYNQTQGVLETFCMGGQKHAKNLQAAFCKRIFNFDYQDEQIIKNNFDIEFLKYRKNKLQPCPKLGVLNPRITTLELCIPGIKRRRHKLSLEENVDGDEIYNILEHDFDTSRYPMTIVKVVSLTITLDMMLGGNIRPLRLLLKPNSCSLKSNFEELRTIGEQYLLEERIDVQPRLF